METLFGPDAGDEGRDDQAVPPPDAPLAVRMRPRAIEDLVGQRTLLAEGAPLRVAIETGRLHSMILHGPPGSGKTTLARIVAAASDAAFEEASAVNTGRPEVRAVIERARERRAASNRPTIFFLDEIHRFNKAQQDALLPAVEEGLVTLIGATTENPAFEVDDALLSRTQLYVLEPLALEDVRALLDRALEGDLLPPRAEGPEPAALDLIAGRAGGDARAALSTLELALRSAGAERLTTEHAREAIARAAVRYDRAADRHYDMASAWIKATRGSDPDASLLYLAVMLEGGEDARFIARRMVIFASEDVGNADPQALVVAVAAAQAVEHVGLPEAQLNLAQAAIYLALAPKSNAATEAIGRARDFVRRHGEIVPPPYLRPAARPGAPEIGPGLDYEYPHDLPGHVGTQRLLPDDVDTRFYEPDDAEPTLRERLARIRRTRGLEP